LLDILGYGTLKYFSSDGRGIEQLNLLKKKPVLNGHELFNAEIEKTAALLPEFLFPACAQ
jgi:hypothetical protein